MPFSDRMANAVMWVVVVGLLALGSLLWPLGDGAPSDEERRAAETCASVPAAEQVACQARVLTRD